MVSQNGYVGSTPSVNPSAIGFVPNLSLDGITGTIHARQGSIGGFELTKNYLQSTESGTGGNKNLILNGITGKLTANDATIKGHIDAISGTFAGELSAATGTFAGSLTAATGTFSGELSAVTGAIGGFNIEEGKLITTGAGLSGVAGVGNDNPAFWAGGTYEQAIANTAKTILRHDGSGHLANGNILWDENGDTEFTGVVHATGGEFIGKIQSGATGNRFIIDPAGPTFKMIDTLDRQAVFMYFSGGGSYYNGVIQTNAYVTTVLNSYSLLSGDGLEVLHMNPNRYRGYYNAARMMVRDSSYNSTFSVNVAVGSPTAQTNKLIIEMTNLPTSSEGLTSGMLYRDNNNIKIV